MLNIWQNPTKILTNFILAFREKSQKGSLTLPASQVIYYFCESSFTTILLVRDYAAMEVNGNGNHTN